jgi:uncharacterized protein (TIGR03435 family)
MLEAQASGGPAFEVTSVKQNRLPIGQRNAAMECAPNGRFVARGLNPRPVLLWAYHLQYFQLSPVPPPAGAGDAVFDIEARAAGPVSQDKCRRMVQALFVDRFKMSIHREMKEFSVYALVVAKDGPKMTKVTDGMKDPGVGLTINGFPAPAPPEGWSMEHLRDAIGGATTPDRPVVDRTGLQGFYKVLLDITLAPTLAESTDLATAARRLGLIAEPRKEPFEMIVIDHIEMPDEN